MMPIEIKIVLLLLFACVQGWALHTFYAKGVQDSEDQHALVAAKAAESDHKNYLAAVEWGNQITVSLMATNRKITDMRTTHETFARGIPGTCPDSLRVLHDAAASGSNLPIPASGSSGPTATFAASAIGSVISKNYAEARQCQAQLNSLIDWHNQIDHKPVNKE